MRTEVRTSHTVVSTSSCLPFDVTTVVLVSRLIVFHLSVTPKAALRLDTVCRWHLYSSVPGVSALH